MTEKQLDALRKWVKAEIEYAFAVQDVGADGYYSLPRKEQNKADELFNNLKNIMSKKPDEQW